MNFRCDWKKDSIYDFINEIPFFNHTEISYYADAARELLYDTTSFENYERTIILVSFITLWICE